MIPGDLGLWGTTISCRGNLDKLSHPTERNFGNQLALLPFDNTKASQLVSDQETSMCTVFTDRLGATTWQRRSSQGYSLEINPFVKGNRQIWLLLVNLPAISVDNVGLWASPDPSFLSVKLRGWAVYILWPPSTPNIPGVWDFAEYSRMLGSKRKDYWRIRNLKLVLGKLVTGCHPITGGKDHTQRWPWRWSQIWFIILQAN